MPFFAPGTFRARAITVRIHPPAPIMLLLRANNDAASTSHVDPQRRVAQRRSGRQRRRQRILAGRPLASSPLPTAFQRFPSASTRAPVRKFSVHQSQRPNHGLTFIANEACRPTELPTPRLPEPASIGSPWILLLLNAAPGSTRACYDDPSNSSSGYPSLRRRLLRGRLLR